MLVHVDLNWGNGDNHYHFIDLDTRGFGSWRIRSGAPTLLKYGVNYVLVLLIVLITSMYFLPPIRQVRRTKSEEHSQMMICTINYCPEGVGNSTCFGGLAKRLE